MSSATRKVKNHPKKKGNSCSEGQRKVNGGGGAVRLVDRAIRLFAAKGNRLLLSEGD